MPIRQEYGQLWNRYHIFYVSSLWGDFSGILSTYLICIVRWLFAAVCHPTYIPLKVCVLVVQIRPWHVLWLSPLLRLVSWGAGPGVLSPSGLLSLRLDEVAAQAVVCGRALWHLPHLLLWSPNWLTTGAEDKQSPQEPIPLASLEWFR